MDWCHRQIRNFDKTSETDTILQTALEDTLTEETSRTVRIGRASRLAASFYQCSELSIISLDWTP